MALSEKSFNWKLHLERNSYVAEIWLFPQQCSTVTELVFARKLPLFFQQSGDCNQPHFYETSALSTLSNLLRAVTVRAKGAHKALSGHQKMRPREIHWLL